MWIFHPLGFFSVVAAQGDDGRVDPSRIVVRARDEHHLRALVRAFPELRGAEVMETPRSDYRWRIVVDWMTWTGVCQGLAAQVDYPNFKNRCGVTCDRRYVRALHRVWTEMLDLQEPRG